MFTTTKRNITSFKERGSEFIGVLFPCAEDTDFQSVADEIRSEHYKASHHCYAYRMGLTEITEFSSDDGEPSGTAGLPILNALRSSEITNAGLIVVRYFGGTKLGKSGLIEAYGRSARESIRSADLSPIVSVVHYRIVYAYPEENLIQNILTEFDLVITKQEYLEEVTLHVACPVKNSDALLKKLNSVEHQLIEFKKLQHDIMLR